MPAPTAVVARDRLDEPVRLLPARLWAGFAALTLVVVAVAVWAFVATLPQHVSARGVILHGPAALAARAPAAGSVAAVAVAAGEPVRRGQVVATVAAGKERLTVRAPADGVVMRLLAAQGGQVLPGAPLVSIDPVGRRARAVLVVDDEAKLARLAPGQRVDLGGSTFGHGTIASITPYPASDADLVARFGTAQLPGVPAGGPKWLVDVTLEESSGPAPALAPVAASVLVDREHPYRFVFGGSR